MLIACTQSLQQTERIREWESVLMRACSLLSISIGNPYAGSFVFLFCLCIAWLLPVSERQHCEHGRARAQESARRQFQFECCQRWQRGVASLAASLSHALLDAARFRSLCFRNAHATSTFPESSFSFPLTRQETNQKHKIKVIKLSNYDRLCEGYLFIYIPIASIVS